MRTVVVSALVAAFALVVACGVDVDVSNKACPCGDGYVCDTTKNVCVTPAALLASKKKPTCDPCTCTTNEDCLDPTRTVCMATSAGKVCVECDPANDTCPQGSYCNAKSQCVVGCRASADCAKISPQSPYCATDRHQCVACQGAAGCTTTGATCSPSGTCVKSCTNNGGSCAGGGTCCGGYCVDTTNDALNCGACGTACADTNGTPICAASSCSATCASGFMHCGAANSGCETDIRTDPNNCGGCGNVCSLKLQNVTGPTCASNTCTFTACQPGFIDNDGDPTNGCEATCGHNKEICCPNRQCSSGSCTGSGQGKCNGGGH